MHMHINAYIYIYMKKVEIENRKPIRINWIRNISFSITEEK